MPLRFFRYCWVLWLVATGAIANGQTYWQSGPFRFDHLTVEKGLPTPTVIDVIRDRRGFVWFYSVRDIVRYDGFEFRTYPFANLPYDIQRFGDDALGNLYTTDGTSLYRYSAIMDRFIPVPLPEPAGVKEALSFIRSTIPGPRCLFRHGDRLYTLCTPHGNPALIRDRLLPSDRYVGLQSRNGDVWLANTDNGTQTSIIERIRPDGSSMHEIGTPVIVHDMQEDREGNIWMGGWASGIWRLDAVSKQTRNFPDLLQYDNAFEIGIFPQWTGEDLLWCNYGAAGLCLFNRKEETVMAVLHANEFQKQSLQTTNLYSFYYDLEHILWFGHHLGVSMLHPRKQRIRQWYFHQPTDEYFSLPVESPKPLLAAERFLLFREDDIKIFDPVGKTWRVINKEAHGLREHKSGRHFYACIDHKSRFWLSTPTGLYHVERQSGKVTRKVAGLTGKKWVLGAIYPDTLGNIWWFDRYLRRYDTNSSRVETILDGTDTAGLLPYEGKVAIQAAAKGQLWLCGFNAVVRFDPASRKVTARLHLKIPPAGEKFSPIINRMVSEGDTLLWLTTTFGLVRLDVRSGQQVVYYPQSDSTLIFGGLGLALDRFGNIWTGDHNAIYRLNRQTGRFNMIDQRDGCSANVLYNLVPNGDRLLANRYLGVVDEINPEIFQRSQAALPVYITDLFFGEMRLPVNLDSTVWKPYHFQARDRAISIHYTAIDFEQPHKVRFEYRLEPFDRDWVQANGDRKAVYTNLEGGQYRFRVRAINADGIVSESALPLRFFVPPIWYRSWWFYTLCGLSLGFVFYAIFRYRERRRLEQEMLRLRIARDLHDEMGSTLSSISILSEAALRHLQADIDRARFGAIGERARQVMEAMADMVWSVNPRNDDMANVLQRMKEFAIEILEPVAINLHFTADPPVSELPLRMEQRKDLYLLYKEALNNAAKYSGARDVWVRLWLEEGRLRMEIHDNGCGFDPATVRHGNGLWNMQRRAEQMKARFSINSTVGEGTRIKVVF